MSEAGQHLRLPGSFSKEEDRETSGDLGYGEVATEQRRKCQAKATRENLGETRHTPSVVDFSVDNPKPGMGKKNSDANNNPKTWRAVGSTKGVTSIVSSTASAIWLSHSVTFPTTNRGY